LRKLSNRPAERAGLAMGWSGAWSAGDVAAGLLLGGMAFAIQSL